MDGQTLRERVNAARDPAAAALKVAATRCGYTLADVRGTRRKADLVTFRRAVVRHLRAWGWTYRGIGDLLHRERTSVLHLAAPATGGADAEVAEKLAEYGEAVRRAFALLSPDYCGCGAVLCLACARIGLRRRDWRGPQRSACAICGRLTPAADGRCKWHVDCPGCGGWKRRDSARCADCAGNRAGAAPRRVCPDCGGYKGVRAETCLPCYLRRRAGRGRAA